MTKKKTASQKKATSRSKKKTTKKAASKTSRKKTTKKTAKKKSAKKKATKKRTAKKNTVKKKTSKSTVKGTGKSSTKKKKKTKSTKKKSAKSGPTAKGASGDAGSAAEATPKKKKRQSKKRSDSRRRGRSVSEVASSESPDEQGYVFINGRRVRMISTAGKTFPPRTKVPIVEEKPVEEKPVKLLKTKLTKKQLNHYRGLLLIKRAELVGDLSAMEAAALRSSGGELSHMPIHMADIGSDTYDQDFTLGLAENERQHLREIDEALQRIEDRTYGVCQMTGKDIPKARLEAKPWAKYTIEAARIVESQMPR